MKVNIDATAPAADTSIAITDFIICEAFGLVLPSTSTT
jgi:hypothetical protein